jgi:hypothetical protein
MKKARKHSHYRSAETSGLPCASGFNGFLRALPGEPGFFATIALRRLPQSLISASGYQDHATSPSASDVVRLLDTARVHRIPHPTFVTIAKRPSYRARNAQASKDDLPDVTSERPATHWHDGQISAAEENRVKDFVIQASAKQLLDHATRLISLYMSASTISRHARACRGHPRLTLLLRQRRGWPGRSPAMTNGGTR